jgi:hypothetical protein
LLVPLAGAAWAEQGPTPPRVTSSVASGCTWPVVGLVGQDAVAATGSAGQYQSSY